MTDHRNACGSVPGASDVTTFNGQILSGLSASSSPRSPLVFDVRAARLQRTAALGYLQQPAVKNRYSIANELCIEFPCRKVETGICMSDYPDGEKARQLLFFICGQYAAYVFTQFNPPLCFCFCQSFTTASR